MQTTTPTCTSCFSIKSNLSPANRDGHEARRDEVRRVRCEVSETNIWLARLVYYSRTVGSPHNSQASPPLSSLRLAVMGGNAWRGETKWVWLIVMYQILRFQVQIVFCTWNLYNVEQLQSVSNATSTLTIGNTATFGDATWESNAVWVAIHYGSNVAAVGDTAVLSDSESNRDMADIGDAGVF